MAPGSNVNHKNGISSTNVAAAEMSDDRKSPRHPRWTKQETLILIEGKKLAEERGRRGRRTSSFFGEQFEPKWDFISSHCRQHGVNRGPVQCRKRWSNLLSDFKKIQGWEFQVKREGETFWMMRSDLRRERKLPGYFDKDVYDVLDGKTSAKTSYELVLVPTTEEENFNDGLGEFEPEDEDEMVGDEETEDGLFSEFEEMPHENNGTSPAKEKLPRDGKRKKIHSPVPISEIKYQPCGHANSSQENREDPGTYFRGASEFQEGAKRRRQSSCDCQNVAMAEQLAKAIERTTSVLTEQLEAQKLNYQQQKNQQDSLLDALNKITETLEKIASKM